MCCCSDYSSIAPRRSQDLLGFSGVAPDAMPKAVYVRSSPVLKTVNPMVGRSVEVLSEEGNLGDVGQSGEAAMQDLAEKIVSCAIVSAVSSFQKQI